MASQDNANTAEAAENKEIIDDIKLLTEDHFTEILHEKYGDFKIKNFDVKRALKNGENYGSLMLRASIEIERKDGKIEKEQFIVKLMPQITPGDMAKKLQSFTREVEMYEKIIPSFEEHLKEYGIDIRFGPKIYKSFNDPDIMIMEDLTNSAFKNINRQNGMDMTHIKATLTKLAKFHAASACIYEKSGSYPHVLTDGIFTEELLPILQHINTFLWSSMFTLLREWDSCQEYFDKIEAYLPRIVDLNREVLETDPNAFNVLTHGDLWANNIMFQYTETGDIKDLYLVDFQMSQWGSPAIDLQYFFISSAANDIKIKEFDSMIKFYHDQLISDLKLLEYSKPLPKLVDLHTDILKKGFMGVYTAFFTMSGALSDPHEDSTVDNFLADSDKAESMKRRMYTNPRYKAAVEIVLPFFDNRGLLDL